MKNGIKERTDCQKETEANPDNMEAIDRAIAVLEQMIAMTKTNEEKMEDKDLEANPE